MMESEENRLYTFGNWPRHAPVDPTRIARNGFYATGNELETICHWCKGKISDWIHGDHPAYRHRRLNSQCPFLLNRRDTNNVPITKPSDMTNEQTRLATFNSWPVPFITPQSLAKAGFYYTNQSDRVACAWCNGHIAKWEDGDNPFTVHLRFFPYCPRAQLGPNIEIANGIRDLGIQSMQTPRQQMFSTLDARLRTFAQWPRSQIQDPEVLATAGFYYQNFDDQVKCFHCDGGLRSWQKEDDPWFEHARYFPKCLFVRLAKGESYINSVQESVQQMVQPTLDEAMASEPVQQALQMGLHEGRIRAATKKHLEKYQKPHANVETLVEAVLGSQHDEDEEDEMNQSSATIVRQVSRILESIFNPRTSSTSSTSDYDFYATRSRTDGDSNDNEAAATTTEGTTTAAAAATNEMKFTSDDSVPDPTSVAACSKTYQLEEENRKLKDARLCKICMVDEISVVFLPCGHFISCVQCAPGVSDCPFCRSPIKAFVRTFLS